jgi:polyphenol oxidase
VPARATRKKLEVLRSPVLSRISWLVHGFSTRVGGFSAVYGGRALNLGFTKHDARAAVERNRAAFLKRVGAIAGRKTWPLVTLRQIHSDIIHCVSEVPSEALAGDGLVTSTPGILLGVQTADCLPVILVDTKRRAIGTFHAGWRGTLARIVEKGVGEMRRRFGTDPRDIRAAIGPGIHSCCYEVGLEVREKFESQFSYANELFRESKESEPVREKYPLLFLSARPPGHTEVQPRIFLDLAEANRRQLMSVGVAARNITASELCTACRTDLLFSHRAEKGVTGRMIAVAAIKNRRTA